jgi:hypothetical protein
MQNRNCYVYAHYDNNGKLKYIGNGSKYRAWSFSQRSIEWTEYFKNIIPEVKILKGFLTKEEANLEEINQIKLAIKNGDCLLNLQSGGDVHNPRSWSDEAKLKLSIRRKGSGSFWFGKKRERYVIDAMNANNPKNYWKGRKRDSETMRKLQEAGHTKECIEKRRQKMLGRKLTIEHRKKISEGNIGKRIGWNPSEETRLKMRLSHLGKPGNKHTEASKEKIRLAHLGMKASESARKKIGDAHRGKQTSKAKKVLCVETGEVFRCASEASIQKHANIKHIQACCVGRRQCTGGFTWRYFE